MAHTEGINHGMYGTHVGPYLTWYHGNALKAHTCIYAPMFSNAQLI